MNSCHALDFWIRCFLAHIYGHTDHYCRFCLMISVSPILKMKTLTSSKDWNICWNTMCLNLDMMSPSVLKYYSLFWLPHLTAVSLVLQFFLFLFRSMNLARTKHVICSKTVTTLSSQKRINTNTCAWCARNDWQAPSERSWMPSLRASTKLFQKAWSIFSMSRNWSC